MSDHTPAEPGQENTALPPELVPLDAYLLAEGRRWRRTEPSTAGLERHVRALVQASGPGRGNEDGMLTERTVPDSTTDPRPSPNRRPPSRWRGPLALVATIMLIALAASIFAFLRTGATGTGSHQQGQRATPTPGLVRVTAPQPKDLKLPITRGEYLQGISFSSALDGWAVGGVIIPQNTSAGSVVPHAVLLHYHNGVWESTADIFPHVSLNAISMLSATDGWAVGQVNVVKPTDRYTGTVLLHFASGHWKIVSTPALATLYPQAIHMLSPDSGYITGVVMIPSATASGSVWARMAVGVYQNGAWKLVTTPFEYPNSQVVMVSASEGWASTNRDMTVPGGVESQRATVYHYLNGVWTASHSFEGWVTSLSAQSPYDVWLLATQCVSCTEPAPRIERYNGSTWSRMAAPNNNEVQQGQEMEQTVFDGGAAGIWASYVTADLTLPDDLRLRQTTMWRFTGSGWTVMSHRVTGGEMVALTVDHSGGMWAITQSDSGAPQQTTILYTQGSNWKVYGQN